MDKCLKPPIFDATTNAADSSRKWKRWKRSFLAFTSTIKDANDADKLDPLFNLLDTSVYAYISECTTYKEAISELDDAHIKRVNEVYARYRLSTCRQNTGESSEEFLQRLKILSADCNFVDMKAAKCQDAAI